MNEHPLRRTTLLLAVLVSVAALPLFARPSTESVTYLPLVLNAEGMPDRATATPFATALATATRTATATASPTPTEVIQYGFSMQLDEELRWYEQTAIPPPTYDIVLVQDYSSSIKYCWDTRRTCPVGQRLIDYSADFVRHFVDEMLVQLPDTDTRIAYLTFSSGGGQPPTKLQIPFGSRDQTIAAFEQLIGSVDQPLPISDTLLRGATPTAFGLAKAQELLQTEGRMYDDSGNPIHHIVIVLTDFMGNVLYDPPLTGLQNTYYLEPYHCGTTGTDVSNPVVQYSCPRGPEYNEPRSPIRTTIDFANALRNQPKPVHIYAVAIGWLEGLSLEQQYFDQVADPGSAYFIDQGALDAIVNELNPGFGPPCTEQIGTPRPADGAQFSIRTAQDQVVAQGRIDTSGSIQAQLPAGTYRVTVKHLDVVAPDDPHAIARDYTQLQVPASNPPLPAYQFTMPASAYHAPDGLLVIDDPANAACP